MIAVKIEIGISDAVALLAKVSMTIIKNAPRLMLTGITLQLLFPRIILEICGTQKSYPAYLSTHGHTGRGDHG